ncbi:response regulator transcription factor [Actinokineospora sp. NBRC 105648]|uniref:response regulator n=1 Tax=Actinokineospora sp. NBRC 105648 TaxID=3032206 RepID=UPI0024A4409E|nr:response regulator transcription factor [Actinokineospora sp. NBRC 105648]GLZ37024.1 DNA-binding response regulator [Actinokineospora sp. NBRC 105648]
MTALDDRRVGEATTGILLVDDHPLFRSGTRAAIEGSPDLDIVGEAATAEEALALLAGERARVDVVLLDIQLPGASGIELARAITEDGVLGEPAPRVIIVSITEDDDSVVAALRAGALGYLLKGVSRDELLRAVRTVAAGGAVFSPSIAGRLRRYFSAVHELPGRVAFPELTERERQVLDLIARGHTNRRIARKLVLSEKTVRNHVTHVFTKLRVRDREAAAVRARDAGLG